MRSDWEQLQKRRSKRCKHELDEQKGNKMKTEKTIWVASQPDLFDGYGLMATGRTEQEAKEALWQGYLVESADWNSDEQVFLPNLNRLEEYWGIKLREYAVGQAYFGDKDEADRRKEQKRKEKKQ